MFLSSLYFALLAKLKIWQTTETYSPQIFAVTATNRSDLLHEINTRPGATNAVSH